MRPSKLAPKWSYLLILVLSILAAISALQIEKNTSAFFLAETHPSRVDHTAHQNTFTRTAYSTFVLLKLNASADIYRNELISFLQGLHQRLDDIDLIELTPFAQAEKSLMLDQDISAASKDSLLELYNQKVQVYSPDALNLMLGQYLFPIKTVKSLINTDNIYELEDELLIEPSYLARATWSDEAKQRISSNALLKGGLFSEDEKGLVVQIEFAIDEDDTILNLALVDKIKNAVGEQVRGYPVIESVHYAGGPILNNTLSLVMEQDNATYFPLVILFVLITLTLFYRSMLCAAYGLAIAVLSIIYTMALMPFLGVTLNIVTTILPVFIITIAVTDAIHVMSDVKGNKGVSNQQAVSASIKKLFRPMLLTSLTTGVGFMSLTFTEIGNIKDFGLMVAISVFMAFLLSVTVLPALLRLKPINSQKEKSNADSTSKASAAGLFEKLSRLAATNVWPALSCAALAIAFTAYGLPNLKVDQASIDAFDQRTELRQDNEAFIQSGTGSVMLNIWLSGASDSGVLQPEVLMAIKDVQTELENHAFHVDSSSIVDFLERTHKTLDANASPLDLNDTERVRQYLFLLEGGAERDLESIVSVGDYKHTRIAISLARDNSSAAADIQRIANQMLEDTLPESMTVRYAGYASIALATADEVLQSQLNSLVSSVVAILLVFLIVFRSVTTAIVGMIPLTATLATMFGVMGVFNFPLDVGSSLVAGIAFGIGIDYAIHLIEAVRRCAHLDDRQKIIQAALQQVSVPIVVSAIVLSSGFSLLLLSGFKSLASLGLLVMVSMLVSAVFSLFIVPQILRFLPRRLFRSIAKGSGLGSNYDASLPALAPRDPR